MSDGKIGRALGLGSIALGMAMSAGCIEVRIGCTEGLVIDGNRCVAAIDAGPTDVVGTMDRTVPKDVAGPTDAERSDGVGGDQGAGDASACPTGATRCAGACVLLTSDAAHCGACGNACAAGQSCSAGVCGTVCPMGTSLCGTTCVALGGGCTSVGSGGCETAGMTMCTAGSAVCSAAPRTSGACGVPFNGACGAAGVCACAAGTHLCAGSCVSDTAVTSCGTSCTPCGAPLNGTATCVGGVCGSACPAGTSACSGACVALTTGTNCGACGVACGAGQTCSGGACVPSTGTCPAGMALIPAGTFMMGDGDTASADAQPPHMVTLSSYCMDLTEVTVAAYRGCTATGCSTPSTGGSFNWGVTGRDNHPINGVDWNQARAYCQWRGGDLPTEAQWEYAARGSDVANHIYLWGNAAPASQLCWSGVTGRTSTCAVQSYPSGNSPFGLFDMAGNVWEWTRDFYASYTSAAAIDPTGPTSGTNRVFRGGSWNDTSATDVRAAYRFGITPMIRNDDVGVRCARPPSSAPSSCAAILAATPGSPSGTYTIDRDGGGPSLPVPVYCDMVSDGGGWMLVFSNANNWRSTSDHTLARVESPSPTSRWFDSEWRVTAAASSTRLGRSWDGVYPLEPEDMGAIDVLRWYSSGLTSVRFQFERGADRAVRTGWCDTTDATWNWSAAMSARYTCRRPAPYGTNTLLCLSGVGRLCDGRPWNAGWNMALSLGDARWDYANQAAPNHLITESITDLMVAGFDQTSGVNNARGLDYAVRIWLREPRPPSSVPSSCAAILAATPGSPSGTYTIDPDGAGSELPASVYCDMTTMGGGWTLVFVPTTTNNSTSSLDYTYRSPALLTAATQSLLGYRNLADLGTATGAVRFPMPANWRLQSPMRFDARTDTVVVTTASGSASSATLVYGWQNWGGGGDGTSCGGDWLPADAPLGRVCIRGTTAPALWAFADGQGDYCSVSNLNYRTATCTSTSAFTIAVR